MFRRTLIALALLASVTVAATLIAGSAGAATSVFGGFNRIGQCNAHKLNNTAWIDKSDCWRGADGRWYYSASTI